MTQYHKIQTIFKRDDKGRLREWEWSTPEFEWLQDAEWGWTEKVDGTNIRVIYNGGIDVQFGGKTDHAQIPAELVNHLKDTFDTPAAHERFNEVFGSDPACLYGEGFGRKIQKGGGLYNPDGVGFILFDVKVGEWWLQYDDGVADVAAQMGIDFVPAIGCGTLIEAAETARAGFNSKVAIIPETPAEGLVLRPKVRLRTERGDRIIAKTKQKDFARVA